MIYRPGLISGGKNSVGDLSPDHESGLRQLVRLGIFGNLFDESGAESIGAGENASNHTFRSFIETSSIGGG
jgi:hypothetical protein